MIFSKYLVFDSGVFQFDGEFQLFQTKKLKTGSDSGQSWQFLVYAIPESNSRVNNFFHI